MDRNILTTDGLKGLLQRPGTSFIEKFGRNRTIASGTSEDIWDGGGIYDFPDIATILDISSTSAEDGAGTLTGALTISVQGLDENWRTHTETITLNGTGTVNSVAKFIRVFRARVETAGSSGSNVGVISIDSQEEVITMAHISAGIGQTNMALYTVPQGKIGYLYGWYVSILRSSGTGSIAADVDMFRRNFASSAWRSTHPVGVQNTGMGTFTYRYLGPIELPEKSDIVVNASPTAVADISAGFTVIIIHK